MGFKKIFLAASAVFFASVGKPGFSKEPPLPPDPPMPLNTPRDENKDGVHMGYPPATKPKPSDALEIAKKKKEFEQLLSLFTSGSLIIDDAKAAKFKDFFEKDEARNTTYLSNNVGFIPSSAQAAVTTALERIKADDASGQDYVITVTALAWLYANNPAFDTLYPRASAKIDEAFGLVSTIHPPVSVPPKAPAKTLGLNPPATLDLTKEPLKSAWPLIDEEYRSMSDEEKQYFNAMLTTRASQINSLASGARRSGHGSQFVADEILRMFDKYTSERKKTESKLGVKPSVETSAPKLLDNFNSNPSTKAIFGIQDRLAYLQKSIDDLNEQIGKLGTTADDIAKKGELESKRKTLSDELSEADQALSKLGFSGATVQDKFLALVNLVKIVEVNITNGDFGKVADFLTDASVSEERKKLVLRELDSLNSIVKLFDKKFVGLSFDSAAAELRSAKASNDSAAIKGQEKWAQFYALYATKLKGNLAVADRTAFDRMAKLDYAASVAFFNATKSMESNDLLKEQAVLQMMQAVSDLVVLNPLLISRYFPAIGNLAKICRDDPDTFVKAVSEVTIGINVVVNKQAVLASRTNVLGASVFLVSAFDQLATLPDSALSKYSRQQLKGDFTYLSPYSPYEYRVRNTFGFSELVPRDYGLYQAPMYTPFANVGVHPVIPSFLQGSIGGTYNEGSSVLLPGVAIPNVYSYARESLSATRLYLDPAFSDVYPAEYFPGSQVRTASYAALLKDIRSAFIPSVRMPYAGAGEVTGGGGILAAGGRKAEKWENSYLGFAQVLSPTGGKFLGGSQTTFGDMDSKFIGGGWTGEKIGKVDINTGVVAWSKDTDTSSETQKVVGNTLLTVWDPKNPANVVFSTTYTSQLFEKPGFSTITAPLGEGSGSRAETPESGSTAAGTAASTGGEATTAKTTLKEGKGAFYYIDKNGNLYEMRGNYSDFQALKNGVFAQVDSDPVSVGGNVYAKKGWEKVTGGGGLFAVDIGNTSLLAMGQAVPGFEGQVLFSEWVAAAAVNASNNATWTLYFPGTKAGEVGGELFVQRGGLRYTNVKDPLTGEAYRWDVLVGGGKDMKGKPLVTAALGYKYQNPDYGKKPGEARRPSYWGFSASYTGAESMMDALAADQKSIEDQVNSIHRIAGNIYGSGPVSQDYLMGAYANLIEQFRTGDDSGHDIFLYRFLVFAKSVKDKGFKIRFDTSRFTNMDMLIGNIDQVRYAIANDPQASQGVVNSFRQSVTQMKQAYKQFSLGMSGGPASGQIFFLASEADGNKFLSADPQIVGGKAIVRVHDGFLRSQAYVAVSNTSLTPAANVTTGYASVGGGYNFGSNWFNQFATDVGVMASIEDKSFSYKGAYTTGAVRAYTNAIQYCKDFRALQVRYAKYLDIVSSGKTAGVPKDVLRAIGVPESKTSLSGPEATDAATKLYDDWFRPLADPLEKDFNGKFAVYFNWAAFFPKNDFGRLDLGLLAEIIDKGTVYMIASHDKGVMFTTSEDEAKKAAATTLYTGGSVYVYSHGSTKVSLDWVAGIKVKDTEGATLGVSGGAGASVETGIGTFRLSSIYTDPSVSDFRNPMFPGYFFSYGQPAWTVMLTFDLMGQGLGRRGFVNPLPTPYQSGNMGGLSYGPGY